jgi:hypothetical protein
MEKGNNNPWSTKVVLVSFALLFAFMTPIIVLNFPVLKKSPTRVTPERYLHAAVYSLIGAIITGMILTKNYTKIDYQHTILMEWYGYNNVCIYFDFVPARYVICIYVWFMAFFGVNYCIADMKRLRTLKYLSPRLKSFATNVDRVFMIACCSLPIWPCITPEENMRMHTAPFLFLIIGLPMIFLTRLLILPSCPSAVHLTSVISFSLLSAVKASFTIGAMATKHHVAPSLGHTIDILWTLFALVQPFLAPSVPVLEYRENYWMARAMIEDKTVIYNLLYLPLAICFILSMIGQCLIGAFQHVLALINPPSPDCEKSTRGGKVSSDSSPEPIPLAQSFIGTIFGCLDSLRGANRFYQIQDTLKTPVFATNDGCPVVICLDTTSTACLFPRPIEKPRAHICRIPTLFTCHGKTCFDHRQLLLAVLPQSDTDVDFHRACDDVRDEFRMWDDTDAHLDRSVYDLLRQLVSRFLSSAMFGVSIPTELFLFAGLTPLDIYLYPFYPQWLTPTHYQRQEANRLILSQMKKSPKWPFIEKTFYEMNMSEEEATFALVAPIAMNALGLSMALRQAILFLSVMNTTQREELLSQTSLFESFIWECIRCQGPPIAFIVEKDTDIKTSCGKSHRVKEGTRLLAPLPIVTRDPFVWKEPHTFKPHRFDDHEPSINPEPVPSISFGCPLGTMTDKEQQKNTRQCAFMPLAIPTMKMILRILLQECHWKIDLESRDVMEESKIHNPLNVSLLPDFDVSPSRINGGPIPYNDFAPKGAIDAKFTSFIFLRLRNSILVEDPAGE